MYQEFPSGPMTKKSIALLYFPDSEPRTAVNHLMAWIKRNKCLVEELDKTGYVSTSKMFTPRQVRLIAEYLGEP